MCSKQRTETMNTIIYILNAGAPRVTFLYGVCFSSFPSMSWGSFETVAAQICKSTGHITLPCPTTTKHLSPLPRRCRYCLVSWPLVTILRSNFFFAYFSPSLLNFLPKAIRDSSIHVRRRSCLNDFLILLASREKESRSDRTILNTWHIGFTIRGKITTQSSLCFGEQQHYTFTSVQIKLTLMYYIGSEFI